MDGWLVGMLGLWASINAKECRRTLSSRDCEMIGVVYPRLSRLSNLSPFPLSLFSLFCLFRLSSVFLVLIALAFCATTVVGSCLSCLLAAQYVGDNADNSGRYVAGVLRCLFAPRGENCVPDRRIKLCTLRSDQFFPRLRSLLFFACSWFAAQ